MKIQIPCPRCKGEGQYERIGKLAHDPCHVYSRYRGCQVHLHFCNPCDLCEGSKTFLVEAEIHERVEPMYLVQWVRDGVCHGHESLVLFCPKELFATVNSLEELARIYSENPCMIMRVIVPK